MKKTPLFLGMLLTAALAAVPVLAEDTESTAATSYVTEQYGGCGNWYRIYERRKNRGRIEGEQVRGGPTDPERSRRRYG